MVDLYTLTLFLLAVFTLFLSPGPNMAFVLSHGMAHGRSAGLAAAFGIATADLVLTVLTATGVTAVVAAWPPSFDLLRYLGAMYLLWLAIQAIRAPGKVTVTRQRGIPLVRVWQMAALNCLFNPKALLFFMVFLPQFVVPSHGNVALQLAVLGVTLSLTGLAFNAMLGLFSGKVSTWFSRNPRAALGQSWVLGAVLLTLALRLLLLERPAAR